MGGDELAVVLPGFTLERGHDLARLMLTELEAPFDIDSFSLDISASIGLAGCSPMTECANTLLKCADLALYRAKAARTGIELYSESLDEGNFDRLDLAVKLRRGIEHGDLVLHYQPKVALRGGGHCVEALVRWRHPQLGLIQPQGFIPLAEQTNLIKPLTSWVLEAALEQCREWRDGGLDVRMAINVSTRSLLDRQLLQEIDAALDRWDLPPSALQLEITETKIIADFSRARELLQAMRRMGIRVAIDDFGTGYSSLAQLQQLPADEIKIDKRFVLNMEYDENDAAIVRSTIGLGRNLSLDITAEGVESPEVCDRLERLGCDYVQGYHLGRPVPAAACEREIRFGSAARREPANCTTEPWPRVA
jgi:EAL domain-containing protein (putative c-di-GMP-specific phosphodiesterase class I)